MKINKQKILFGIIILFILMQFLPVVGKPEVTDNNPNDLLKVTTVPENIKGILKTSCYDCHSNETKYPWYSNIAPASWFLFDHIEEGREHLNFSDWGTFSKKKKLHKLDELTEMIEEDEMPLASYTLIHRDANLDAQQKEAVISWAEKMMAEVIKE
jgi:hypothetical protein